MTRVDADFLHDPALAAVLDALEAGGARTLIVGGAVRNALLGEAVGDVDLATDAPPEQVVALAEKAGLKAVPTGIEHGTVTLVSDKRGFEVTTFRRDVETDGRHAKVAFSTSVEEDAQRRDFTMNALYATREGEVIDPVGGLDDLRARRLRFVGDPEARIEEDYLRILRFFRFLAWYGREAEPVAVAACTAMADGLEQISRERVGAEMRKLLAAPDPGPALSLMEETGVLARVLPGADVAPLRALSAFEDAPSWQRRLAALGVHDPTSALRLSKDEARHQMRLTEALSEDWSLSEAGYRLSAAQARDYALIRRAHGYDLPDDWTARLDHAASARLPITAADLQPDLQGPALGRGLRAAEAAWIAGDFAMPAPALIDVALLAGKAQP
ncbi:CCA tRNA nucleotidyltransferase [Paracoccus sp. TK19116]|uniref:CCA tRNA nucleotidyltransferase n=1 Tax=Paracoccus albicereus TaxID=2922394 RepID=A0ABT1MVK5_9RHOB|nr:CCA tRNA nucleotidyltransferase [Paracoccus albicereus]MCQ0970891.1 CCA tRNA nucleotidyltransferase [Paracoccus albicereus]